MNFSLSILIIIVASIDAQELVDIPTTATNAGSFTTLITALQNADLVDALSAPNGPFTVFAPVDDAFAALPSGLLSCLLKPSNIDALRSVLTYHVVSDEIKSTDLVDALNSPTLSGERIFIDLSDGVTVNDEIVAITPDVATSNGVIHIIGSVLIPPSLDVSTFLQSCSTEPSNSTATPTDAGEPEEAGDIPTSASTAGVLETLLAALQAANLVDDLAEPNGPFTLFAPSDEAFGTLPSGLVTCLLEPENSATLTNILTYHVVAGSFSSTNLEEGILPEMLNGEILTIAMDNGVTINDLVTIVTPDVSATNGVIHIIDSVLVPPSIDVYTFLEGCNVEEQTDPISGAVEPALSIIAIVGWIMLIV